VKQLAFRKGNTSDLTELQKLVVGTISTICIAEYNKQQIEVWISGVENKQRWDEITAKQFVLVAELENQIIGFATLDYIDLLYVHKDYQRQGVAQRLLDEIINEARRLKQTELTSDVSKTARPFFEKNNFRVLGEQVVTKKGVDLVNYKMRMMLN
jgi:putative acetyltransferase